MKKTRKMLPVSIYDLSGLEGWLEEQAKAGLFPVFMNGWATFTPTALPGTRFRLEPREGEGGQPGAGEAGEMPGGGLGLCPDRGFPVLSFLHYQTRSL